MFSRPIDLLFDDMKIVATKIKMYTAELRFEDFSKDEKLQSI